MATATAIPTGTWQVDPIHSSIGFEVKHFGISTFRGRFTGYEGTIETSEDGLERVEGSIEVGSFDVEDETLSGHLASEDFFDIEHHPLAHFSSTSVERTGDDSYRLD